MKTVLTLLIALHSFVFGSKLFAGEVDSQPQKLRYEYVIETDLTTEKFSEVFCERLSTKHSWEKISTTVSEDDAYTSIFNFKDVDQHLWECEVKIKKVRPYNKMSVLMTMSPMIGS
jgi:hypothetical protein